MVRPPHELDRYRPVRPLHQLRRLVALRCDQLNVAPLRLSFFPEGRQGRDRSGDDCYDYVRISTPTGDVHV